MIETKQYKNSTLSPITTSAVVGHIGSDTYTISFTIDITSVLEELNRLNRTNNKTLLTVNASEYYNDSVELRPYASYGSVEVPVSILKGEKTYIEFDLTNAIDAYVSGTFTINFGVNVIGVDTSLEPASPYTAYLTVYTENSTSINSLPLIFYRKKDMAHSSIKSEYIRLPLSYGGESIIDMFDLNVKHVVPLFDMNIGTINYPFSLIYNKLDRTNNSYVDSHLPYGWKTSLDMKIKKSDTFDSPLGDKTLCFCVV